MACFNTAANAALAKMLSFKEMSSAEVSATCLKCHEGEQGRVLFPVIHSQYAASRAALTALSGNDFEVGEISAHSAAAPEADQPFLAVAQLSDD
jgi:hypothetical protein